MRISGASGVQSGGCWVRPQAGDQFGIDLVGLGARKLTTGVRLDGRGVDNTNPAPGVSEVVGERFAVGAGRFHAGVQRLDMM